MSKTRLVSRRQPQRGEPMRHCVRLPGLRPAIEALEPRLLLDSVEWLPGLVGSSDLPKYTAVRGNSCGPVFARRFSKTYWF